jgi:hypothetical protein
MKKNIFTTNKIINTEGVSPRSPWVSNWGTRAYEMTQEKAPPTATRMNTTVVMIPVERAIL